MRALCVLIALLPSLALAEDADPSIGEAPEAPTEAPEPAPKPEVAAPRPEAPAPKPEAAAPKPKAEPAREKLSLKEASPAVVVTFESTDPGVRDAVARVEAELIAALGRDGRLKPVSVSAADEAPAKEDLSEAKTHLDAAKAAYDGLDLDTAATEYASAIKVYFAHPVSADSKAVGEAFVALGSAYQLNGDKAHADAAFRFALAAAPAAEPDSENYGPDIRAAFAAQKKALDEAAVDSPTSLDIELEGAPNAEVTVDGQAAGTAPIRGYKVYPGRHLVVARAAGYRPTGEVIAAQAGASAPAHLTLEETASHRTFAGALARAHAAANLPGTAPGVLELARVSSARLVAVGSLASAGTGAKLDVVLFDAATHRRLAGLTRQTLIESSQFPAVMDDLALELGNDFIDPPENALAEDEPGTEKPLLRRWQFWTGVGAGVLLAGAATAYLATSGTPDHLSVGAGTALGLH